MARAWPEEVAPPPFCEVATMLAEPRFASVFCPACRAQVIGPDAETVAFDLVDHVRAAHG